MFITLKYLNIFFLVSLLDGSETSGGLIDGYGPAIGFQIAAAVVTAVWSFLVTGIILFVLNKIPGLHLRVTLEEETDGLDKTELHDMGSPKVSSAVPHTVKASAVVF